MDTRVRVPTDAALKQLRKPKLPKYPKEAAEAGLGAIVLIVVDVNEKGRVTQATPSTVTPVLPAELNRHYVSMIEAATSAARQLGFNPYTVDGEALAFGALIVYRFDPDSLKVSFAAEARTPVVLWKGEDRTAAPNPSPSR